MAEKKRPLKEVGIFRVMSKRPPPRKRVVVPPPPPHNVKEDKIFDMTIRPPIEEGRTRRPARLAVEPLPPKPPIRPPIREEEQFIQPAAQEHKQPKRIEKIHKRKFERKQRIQPAVLAEEPRLR